MADKESVSRYDKAMANAAPVADDLKWHDFEEKPFRLSGFAFHRKGGELRRLPDDPRLSDGVRFLSSHTAGGRLDFCTNSTRLWVRVKLRNASHMDHMAQTGSCGFDLYCGVPGKSSLMGTARFPATADEYTSTMLKYVLPEKMREFTLNFPLYSGVEKLSIGLDPGAKIAAPSPWSAEAPLVVYGTSITQGGCASRPGMAYTAILSRKLKRPVLNFGFSGSGKGEAEVAEYLAGIGDPALYLLDYEPNAMPDGMRATLEKFIAFLRKAHPETPIIILSSLRFNEELCFNCDPAIQEARMKASQLWQRRLVSSLRRAGDDRIFFVSGATLTGKDWHEFSVDGVHQTDLGFYVMAKKLLPKIKAVLK